MKMPVNISRKPLDKVCRWATALRDQGGTVGKIQISAFNRQKCDEKQGANPLVRLLRLLSCGFGVNRTPAAWPERVVLLIPFVIQDYADAAHTTPIDSTNYTGSIYSNWDANGYRLPTEGEREYFTRAGTTGPFSISEPAYNASTFSSCTAGILTALESVAWFCANDLGTTQPVGGKAANSWGLKDVHGNVWEWCWDWYSGSYPGTGQTDYRGPSSGSYRVLRGGAYGDSPQDCRSGFHYYGSPSGLPPWYSAYGGFRLVRSVN